MNKDASGSIYRFINLFCYLFDGEAQMFSGRRVKIIAATVSAILICIGAVAVKGGALAPDLVKIAPAMVSADTSMLPPEQAQTELSAVWRLFDRDTETAYAPAQISRLTVSLSEQKTINRIRVYGSSSYQLNVYRDNAGTWEPVIGGTLQSLGSSWNDLTPAEPFSASLLLVELVPQQGATSGLRELEIWGNEASGTVEGTAYATLENIRTPKELLDLLSKSPSHIMEFGAYPSEISVPDGTLQQTSGVLHFSFTQNPVLFKRAYLLYDGYNIYRSVSLQKRINNLSWTGGFSIPQPEGTTPAWTSFAEEINPAWLIQGENTIEFKTSGGSASIRGLKLIVETDSGWNSLSSASDPKLFDGDISTTYGIRASLTNPVVQINFERKVQPEKLRLHLPGSINIKAGLQYRTATGWQDVKPGWQMDLSTMQAGWNEIAVPTAITTDSLQIVFFTSSLKAKPGVLVGSINEVRVAASPAGSPASERIIISYPRDGEYFGRTAYIQGFAVPSASGFSTVNVNIEGKTSSNSDGAFSFSLTKDETRFSSQTDDDEWAPVAKSDYAGRQAASVTVVLNKNSSKLASTDPNKESRGNAPFGDNREKHTETVSPGQAKKIQYGGVTLDIPIGAVDKNTDITIVPLSEADLAHYNPGMINVTYPAAGYRFLPHGMKFKKAITISFGYAKQLFAAGQTDNDVNMYYYDESLLRWQQLTRVKVDSLTSQVSSSSDHFTDIINSTLVVPEHPQALSFNPNSIKDIKAADPSANIDLIEPPKATSMGTANLSYPIEVPKGRGAYTPDLKVSYSSNNANGWMGLGWDIPISKIQVDTRWGVPHYDRSSETESYLLDGASLAPYVPRPLASTVARSVGDTVFTKRVEGDFRRIVRKNASPCENDPTKNPYYWEVTDKNGVKFIYGQTSQARLSSYTTQDQPYKNIFEWNLEKVIDTNGNVAQFIYDIESGNNGEPFKQIYIKKITYTKRTGDSDGIDGPYTIEFFRSSSRPDVIIDGKAGFQVLTRARLERIDIRYPKTDTLIRQYGFTYIPDSEAAEYHFGKSLLKKIACMGRGGATEFYSHVFSYERMTKGTSGPNSYAGFKTEIKKWTGASTGQALSHSRDQSKSITLSPALAPTPNIPDFGINGTYGKGDSTTLGSLMDINGDGLPDRVYNGGGVELNTLNTDRESGSFTGANFSGLDKLGFEQRDSFSIGAYVGYWIASSNFGYSYNFGKAEQTMADIDGDGLVDHVDISSGFSVMKNTGSGFAPLNWSGYSTDHVDFGTGAVSDKLKGDYFLTDPVRKWIAPYKGTVRITGTISKIKAGGKDDFIDTKNKTGPTASLLAYIYKNNDTTPAWTASLPSDASSSYSHDLTVPVSPGDRLYFRVNSVEDTEADDVSWQPEISYQQLCLTDGTENCFSVGSAQSTLKDPQGNSLLDFNSASETKLSGYPQNTWSVGAKGTVRIKGTIVKHKTSDNVTFSIKMNNTVLWTQSSLAGDEGTFSHDIVQDVMPGDANTKYAGDQITFDVAADTAVDPGLVSWQPEIVYENYCLIKPISSPTQPLNSGTTDYVCGPLVCTPDSNNVVKCRVDVPNLSDDSQIEEKDVHLYGQVNYPLYYLTPTELSRFWVAPYDGKVRVRGSVIRYSKTDAVVAVSRGVNNLFWKQSIAAGGPLPPSDPSEQPDPENFPHDFTVSVAKGDQIFFDIQSTTQTAVDSTQLAWAPGITYTEYCATDPSTGQRSCSPVTESETIPDLNSGGTRSLNEQYCRTYDDNNDGTVDRTVCNKTSCPAGSGPESGACQYCSKTTYTDPKKTAQSSCQPIVCTNDPVEGIKDCSPQSLIYLARPANIRYWDSRYYDNSRPDAEAFAGGYRFWHYGDWNGNIAWDESLIKRSTDKDVPDTNTFTEDDVHNMPSYYFVYMAPRWQGVTGYASLVWKGRGENEYIGSDQLSSSRLGGNVTKMVAGTSIGAIRQSVGNNVAVGVGVALASVAVNRGDTLNKLDLMDMNGDRFPDQVSGSGVLFNNGVNGFSSTPVPLAIGDVRKIHNENRDEGLSFSRSETKFHSNGLTEKVTTPGPMLGLTYASSETESDLIDVNGDGLPDRVKRTGATTFEVELNFGYRFGAPMAWNTDTWDISDISNDPLSSLKINPDYAVEITENATYSLSASYWNIGGGASYTVVRNVVALKDINGDGLPDQILKPTDGHKGNFFYVRLNLGDHFGPVQKWEVPSWGRTIADDNIATWLPGDNDAITYSSTLSWHLSAGFVIPIPIIPIVTVAWIDIPASVSISGGSGGADLEFVDMNGDGMADHVLKLEDDDTVYVCENNVGQTNLLKQVDRPLGGKLTIDYERKGNTVDMPHSQWVLKQTQLADGMGNTYVTTYSYGNGYYDRFEREFYGFDKVVETHAPGTGIERSVIQFFENRNYYLKGLMKKSVTIDSQKHVYAMTANTYIPAVVGDASEFPQLHQTDTHFYDATTSYDGDPANTYGSKKSTYQTFDYDQYGNVTTFFDAGESNTNLDNVTAAITYFEDKSAYIVGKPQDILVTDVNGKTLRKRSALYNNDGTGNLKNLSILVIGNQNSSWSMTYDPYGNIETITDPVNYVLTYTYDTDVNTYVTQITDNFAGAQGGPYFSRASYNLYYGQPDWTQDLNGNYQVNLYDEFGRLSSICGPYDASSGNPPSCTGITAGTTGTATGRPTLAFEYSVPKNMIGGAGVSATPAIAVTHNKAVSVKGSDGKIIDTVTFADGMKRIIQTKKDAAVSGASGMTVSGLIVFDELGRTSAQDQPVFRAKSNTFEDLKNQLIPKNFTVFSYDALDRTKRVVAPDGATTTTSYVFGNVNGSGPLYAATVVVDPEGNKPSPVHQGTKVSYKDVQDRIVAVVEYNWVKDPVSGSITRVAVVTNYAYDPLGQITTVVDTKGNTTSVEYDFAGRRTAITNPDTGRTEYGYDANGNMTSKLTANYQKGKEITYVYDFNRLKSIIYPNSTKVDYLYGAMYEADNRAGRIKQVTDESGTEWRYYGKLGETVREERMVNAKTPPVQQKKFTTDYVFDSFGRMTDMTYPDGEKLHYAYDDGGLLSSAYGEKAGTRYDYIKALTYDEFGQRRYIAYGNGTATTYTYDPLTRRLATLNTTLRDGREVQKLTYEYDLVGNVSILKNGILVATNTALPAGPVEQKFEHDDLYQLTDAKGWYSFGPGKGNNYHNEFLYDTIGNFMRKSLANEIVQPSATKTFPKETNYVLNYQYKFATNGIVKPHAVSETGDKLYTYDPAGNMLGWTSKTNGTKRTIAWNEENRVKQIDDNGKATYFLYDDTGERVIKRGQYGETVYINRFYAIRNGELGTKHVFAGETRVLSKLVKTPPTNTTNTTSDVTTGTTTTIPGINGLDNGRGKKLGIIRRLPDGYQTGVNLPVEKDQFYYHSDHLGSSNIITDAYGAVYQHLEYFPYGETWIEEGANSSKLPGYMFTGKELDPETGLYYYGARYYDAVLSRWISADPALPEYLPTGTQLSSDEAVNVNSLKGRGGVFRSHNLNMYQYAGLNPLKYTDPNGMWIDNGNGSFVAEKGDTLWGLQKETGRDWQKSDFKGDPRKLQIGQKVDFASKNTNQSNITIDSTKEATAHYFGGRGEPAALGPKTQALLRNNPEQLRREARIRNGLTTSLSGNYGVDMTFSMFHVGNTRVDYSSTCGSKSCVTDFSAFSQDGYWDITGFNNDRMGPGGELPGGHPYPYVPYNWTISYPNPYKKAN